MENAFETFDTSAYNDAIVIANELRADCPYRTHTMQTSITVISISDDVIEIAIPVEYASYVNDKPTIGGRKGKNGESVGAKANKNYHWIQRCLDRVSRAMYGNDVDNESMNTGFSYEVIAETRGF